MLEAGVSSAPAFILFRIIVKVFLKTECFVNRGTALLQSVYALIQAYVFTRSVKLSRISVASATH